MKKLAVIFAFVFLIGCKKETTEQVIPKEITWEDTQKVRVLRVELLKKLVAYPFSGDSVFYVEYVYDSTGKIEKITTNHITDNFFSDLVREDHLLNYNSDGLLIRCDFENCFGVDLTLVSNSLFLKNNRIEGLNSEYVQCLFGTPLIGITKREVDFDYEIDGFLKSIKSTFSGDNLPLGRIGTDVLDIKYDEDKLFSYQKVSHLLIEDHQEEVENYFVRVSYIRADDVPNALRRMVNQMIMGLNSISLEEFYINPQILQDDFISENFPEVSTSVFSDWIFSLGIPELQMISSQKTGLVSIKNMKGKMVSNRNGNGGFNYIQVDSTANYPYIHNATNKTLEIAGLKIYYELVE